ncbi:MAG: RidA family protein [Melioribacteraceae bacterium]|nr:RidA family protein [Melioribacteraceae bacterium]MCF8265286.1 RidA family protein [Melioribacteraceae bacterium]MCF8412615.1 RidA family protein [Melioribacteraceae bacterium]MCF8431517.1 RidA family protein [Melioribacteraceae bacterium]
MKREIFSSGTEWEEKVGYSRVVKVGNIFFVSGTTAVNDEGELIGLGDLYKQAKFCFQKIETSLNELKIDLKYITRTRMYVTNIELWEEAGKAHKEFFHNIKPAATMVEVSNLISPDLLIEIEVEGVIHDE